jgi:hypothetical protein
MLGQTWKPWLLLLLVLMSGAGCASSQAFMPAEHVTGLSPQGEHYAAEYQMEGAHGYLGDAKVWSEGAYREEVDGNDETVVRIVLVLDNAVDTPLRLDTQRLTLEDVVWSGGAIGRIPPLSVEGDPVVPPGQEHEIQVSFRMPEDVWPSELRRYRVAWAVTNGGSYAQKTPFLRLIQRRDDYWGPSFGMYYGYGYYSPFYPGWRRGYHYPAWPPYGPRYYRPRPR